MGNQTTTEVPIVFNIGSDELLGIVHKPESTAELGVLVVVGGPQYRVGSHRQFVMLARYLADHNIAAMRFDYRGMGDSSGKLRDFESVSNDIQVALEEFQKCCPAVKRFVIWGLCDAASAALFYGYRDPKVVGLVLLNPWVRTEVGEAKTYIKNYYAQRLLNRNFWKKLLSGGVDYKASVGSFFSFFRKAYTGNTSERQEHAQKSLPDRMLEGFEKFEGKVLLVLSGRDLTADEFRNLVASSDQWKKVLGRDTVTQKMLEESDHTFSSNAWKTTVAEWTRQWLKSLS